jgi:hypothetical protein
LPYTSPEEWGNISTGVFHVNAIRKTPLTAEEAKLLPTVVIAMKAQADTYNQSYRAISAIIPAPGNVVIPAGFLVQETTPLEPSDHGIARRRSKIYYRVETFEDAIAVYSEALPV